MPELSRHCEPTGPAEGRPEDRLREAIRALDRFVARASCDDGWKARQLGLMSASFAASFMLS